MKLYMRYIKMHLQAQLQHKASTLMLMLGQFLGSFFSLLGMVFLFDRFHAIEGFSLQEVLLCYAAVLMAFSLAECIARGFDTFASVIGNGEFDRMLVRPRSLIFQVLASKIEISRLGRMVQALLVFIYAIPASGVVWTADKVFTLFLMVLGGTVTFSALFLVYAAFCFFTLEGLEFMNILTDGGREFGMYPYAIYGKGVLTFLTFVIPLALFQYYPLLYITGRDDSVYLMLLPLAGLLFTLPCYAFWRFGVKRYVSTGS